MTKVLLLSGGADSVATLHIIRKHGEKINQFVYFHYGQSHEQFEKEYDAIVNNLQGNEMKKLKEVHLPRCGQIINKGDKHPFYMGRNMLFITQIMSMHGNCEIYFGTNKEDKYSDNNRMFFDELSAFMRKIYDVDVKVHTILMDWTKKQVVDYCKENNLKYFSD